MNIGFDQPLYIQRGKEISREAAVDEVARRYQALVDIFEEARA
jgi:myo-inositol catabolism protein IolC